MKQKIFNFLSSRAAKFIAKKRPIIVVITGSIGKTSTTQAIATMLRQKYSVLTTKHNYNTDIGVVMSIFDDQIQTNPLSWLLLCVRVFFKSLGKPKHDIYVLELGTDSPGQIKDFAYLKPDIAVVTSLTPEHMEYFKTIEAVAEEELLITHFSKETFINSDMCDPSLVKRFGAGELTYYGSGQAYDVMNDGVGEQLSITLTLKNRQLKAKSKLIAFHSLYAALAAACVGEKLKMSDEEIVKGVEAIEPLSGRMQLLAGINGTTIIDDTYNASPDAVKAALNTLYSWPAKQRIAILGMMNELGDHSESMHKDVGNYCDPTKLDLVVTLGQDANSYIAEAAEAKGCRVIRTESPVKAGEVVKNELKPGAVILAKGSQNGVYAEESVKMLLANSDDATKLVRQISYWPAKKRKQFPDIPK